METGSVQSTHLAIQLTLKELEEAKGDIGRLKFVTDAQGRTVVKATPKWTLKQYLLNTLFHRKDCHQLVKQAHDFLSLANPDTRLRDRVVTLLDNGGFPYMSSREKRSIDKLIHQPAQKMQPMGLDSKANVRETSFQSPPFPETQFDIDFPKLDGAMPAPVRKNSHMLECFEAYKSGVMNFDACKAILENPNLDRQQKQEELEEQYGLSFGMTNDPESTSPDEALEALDKIAYMLQTLSQPEHEPIYEQVFQEMLSCKHQHLEKQVDEALNVFSERVLDNKFGVDFALLRHSMPTPAVDNEQQFKRFSIYEKVLKNYDECKRVLEDDTLSPAEMQAEISERFGLFFHMTRQENPTPPATVLRSLEAMASMMHQLSLPKNADKRADILLSILSSERPCQEAQITHAQQIFGEKMLGIEIPDEDDKNLLDPSLDATQGFDVNFQKLMFEFTETAEDASPEAFIQWAKERDATVGFMTADGEITIAIIEEYAEKGANEWAVLF